jgi:hypothetical protein
MLLWELAMLDSRNWEGGQALVAEVDGRIWAALPLDGGPAIADPFRPTADIIRVLELRRQQLTAEPPPRLRAVRRLLRSPARA